MLYLMEAIDDHDDRYELWAKGEQDALTRPVKETAVGLVVSTPGALALLESTRTDSLTLLARHCTGDWGDVPPEDAQENELSVKRGLRILSSYTLNGKGVWAITEADRSSTTILLPSEY